MKTLKIKHLFHNKHIYIYSHRYSEVLGSKCFCFFKKNGHYAHIPGHMHKTLPTLGNENNSKLNFMKNHQARAQKVRLHNCFFQKYPENFLF